MDDIFSRETTICGMHTVCVLFFLYFLEVAFVHYFLTWQNNPYLYILTRCAVVLLIKYSLNTMWIQFFLMYDGVKNRTWGCLPVHHLTAACHHITLVQCLKCWKMCDLSCWHMINTEANSKCFPCLVCHIYRSFWISNA